MYFSFSLYQPERKKNGVNGTGRVCLSVCGVA